MSLDVDLLIAKGAIEGPFKRPHAITRRRLFWRRTYRALVAFLLAPRPDLINTRRYGGNHWRT